jgi:SAM-dependent methyltransferase
MNDGWRKPDARQASKWLAASTVHKRTESRRLTGVTLPHVGDDRTAPRTLDWGLGRYERTAERLEPAARVVVERAALQAGERVLDLGCGNGNAALLAAACGARVTGVDPASRLLQVGRARASSEGADITFLSGEAASLPVGDASADVILSVFAVIFAPDAVAAAAEMSRVVTAGGRIILSAWIPEGTMFEFTFAAGEAVRQALGAPPPPKPFAWHDRDALSALLAPHGFTVEVEQHSLSFTDTSPAAYLDGESREHPMAVAGLAVLEGLGKAEALRGRLLQILEAGNEAPAGFQITSRYVVATARRETG